MTFDAKTLAELLPAIHRIRDAASADAAGEPRGPLTELLALMAEQIATVEENLAQLYDDLFIETCAEWATAYIGDLIGYRTLHGDVPGIASPRAEVAHTIALRRRKGTASVLEQLARDVTRWPSRAVELFQLVATTQYMNHVRIQNHRTPSLRDGAALEWMESAFETATRTVDVRSIESSAVRHNIPNIAVFLWRVGAHRHRRTTAVRDSERRWRVSPLGHDIGLYNRPEADEAITDQATPASVPLPLSRRRLSTEIDRHYGDRPTMAGPIDNPDPAMQVWVDGNEIFRDLIDVCDLSDVAGGWAHQPPAGRCSIDPVLGRIALAEDITDSDVNPAVVEVTWHRGFVAHIGGGEYDRTATIPPAAGAVPVAGGPDALAVALAGLGGSGVIEITDSRRYDLPASIDVANGSAIEVRAVSGACPTLVLAEPLEVSGGADSTVVLRGAWLTGAGIVAPANRPGALGPNELAEIVVDDCTLVPGHALATDGSPTNPGQPSVVLQVPTTDLRITRTISGPLHVGRTCHVSAEDSIIDATGADLVAIAAADGASAAAVLRLQACTVVGSVVVEEIDEVSDSILLADRNGAPLPAVRSTRTQTGCVRFSYLPLDAIVPRRYRCRPVDAADDAQLRVGFTSLRFGTPAYAQLATMTPASVRRGAESESEMGAYHQLYAPQRETNLRIRLEEYIRVGLRAGIIYES